MDIVLCRKGKLYCLRAFISWSNSRYFIFCLTSSSLVCWQGKEKVNPTGSFLSLMLCFSMKSPRHSATWSNSWNRGGKRERLAQVELKRVRVRVCIILLLFRCREWCPLVCHRFHSPSERSVSSHGWLWHGGFWSYCLPNPTRWSLPFLLRQRGWGQTGRGKREREKYQLAARYYWLI